MKFWDMPWGTPPYNDAGQEDRRGVHAAGGNRQGRVPEHPVEQLHQTFSSAIASKTGPAVSSGGGFQAFQFADQGEIANADKLSSSG